jgi:hypothetical protein
MFAEDRSLAMSTNTLLSPATRTHRPAAAWAAQAWHTLWHANRPLTITVALSLALVAAAVVGLLADPRTITGAPAWMKPLKFAISSAVYAATLAWMLTFVQGRRRLVALAGATVSFSFMVELTLIVVQVLRGTTSHFNISTPLDSALFGTMGFMIALVWVMNGVVAALLLRQRDSLEAGLAWSLRLGLLLSAVGMGVAFLMTSVPTPAQAAALAEGQAPATFGAHSVGVEDGGPGLPLVGWSTVGGDLRVAHFIGLHGLQALPLLALALRRAPRLNERQRRDLVWVAGLGYLGLIGLTTWQALRGQSIIAPDALTLAVGGALAGAAALAALIIARRR